MLTGDSHTERVFDGEDFAQIRIEGVEFVDCTFRGCTLTEARFASCRFQTCAFTGCDMSLLKVPDTTFSEVRLVDTKVIGVDWSAARWPGVSLGDPISFERCALNHSTFLGLSLGGLSVTECIAREVDFRETDLGGADFSGSDLTGCLFSAADLRKADFSRARNYAIPPGENRLEGAKFSLPEALSFLHVLGIELVD